MSPSTEELARKIYWTESMGWDGPGRRRRWPDFEKLNQRDKEYWFARAEVAAQN